MAPERSIPTSRELMWRVVSALRSLGGSGTIQEIRDKVSEIGGFDEKQLTKLHGKGPLTEIEYRSDGLAGCLKLLVPLRRAKIASGL